MSQTPSGLTAFAAAGRPDHLLTLGQACDRTQLSPSTLRRAIRQRRLAVIHVGRAVRIAEADLLAWLAAQRRGVR